MHSKVFQYTFVVGNHLVKSNSVCMVVLSVSIVRFSFKFLSANHYFHALVEQHSTFPH